MVELRRLRTADESPREIIGGVNRIFDCLLGNTGGRISLLDDDGIKRDTIGGDTLGTAEPSLKVRSAVGEHALFEHSDKVTVILEAQDSGVLIPILRTTNLTIGGWNATESGDDLVWKEDGGAERVRFGDSASTYALLVTGDQRVTSSMVINDWKASVSGDDLVWVDDASAEIIRFGDTASTVHFKVTGPAHITGATEIGGVASLTAGMTVTHSAEVLKTAANKVTILSAGTQTLAFNGGAGTTFRTISGVRTGTLAQLQDVVRDVLDFFHDLNLLNDTTT